MNLNEINKDIVKKIDSLNIDINKKNFLKKALIEEYNHRDKKFFGLNDKKNSKYNDIVEEYYK